MKKALKVLMLEDSITDAEIIQRLLKKEAKPFDFRLSTNEKEYLRELEQYNPDIVLADNSLPQYNASQALTVIKERSLHIPFVMVTGTVSEEFAAGIIKQGADDYILKDRLGRLPAAIDMALRHHQAEKEKLEAAERLKQSEENYRTIMERVSDAFVALDTNWRYTYVNKKAGEILNRIPGGLVGKNIWEEFPEGIDQPFHKAYHRAMKEQRYIHLEEYYAPFHIWLENHVYPSPDGLSIFFRNITERKEAQQKIIQSEENLKAIFENTSEGFILTDANGIVKAFNNKTKESVLRNIEEEIKPGRSIFDFVEEPRREFFQTIFLKVMQGENIQYDRSYNNSDGTVTWINFSFNPVVRENLINGICVTGRDISEKKIAEQQKEFDNNNLHALINNTHDLMWSVDRNLQLITSNQAFDHLVTLMTGKRPVKGSDILIPEYTTGQLKKYKMFYERAFAGETFTEIEYSEIPGDFWSEISFYPIYEGKTVIGTACFSRNITEKKRAEEEIKKSNERFEMATLATNDVIWDWDLLTNKIWWNDNYYSHFGYSRESTVEDISSWHRGLHTEDKERVLSGIKATLKEQKDFWSDEYRFIKADGAGAFVLDCGYILYNEKNKPYRMVGAMLDITERKNAEELLKNSFSEKQALAETMATILNTLPANIALLDAKGIIVEVNDAWRNFADTNGFIGSNYGIGDNYITISKLASGEDKIDGKAVARGVKEVIGKKVKEFILEYSCHSPTLKRWFRMVVTPLPDREYAGAVVMHVDISELRRLEHERLTSKMDEQKKITQAMMQAQEKERNQLGRELHDNISQLLAAIKMKLGYGLSNYDKGISIFRECIDHVQEAMTETRNLSHRMVIPRFEENGFENAVKYLISNYRHPQRTVTLEANKLDEKKITAGIKESLYRIVQEQLHNIEKYAGASEVKVILDAQPDQITLTIEDNGVGFNVKQKRKGIGLTNILNRAESYNGSAKIFAEPGKGCKLIVEIPLKEKKETPASL
jgi:PAS domain S-box-containing protein